MIDAFLEAQYNNRARVPEHPAIIAGWAEAAAAYRAANPHELGQAYGPSGRQVFDYFPASDDRGGPIALFIHGGYWQALDKSFFSHMAGGAHALGLPVAVMSYDLCPAVGVGEIVAQSRACAIALWRRFGRPVLAYGHSAGGHLAAMLLATDWRATAPDLPARLVPAALAISGLFDLEKLVPTSINAKLGLDNATARALSPIHLPITPGCSLNAVVGATESEEYHAQTRGICAVWGAAGVKTEMAAIAGANHFTVIASLASPDGELTRQLGALAAAI